MEFIQDLSQVYQALQNSFSATLRKIKSFDTLAKSQRFIHKYKNKITAEQIKSIHNDDLNIFNVYALLMVLNPQHQFSLFQLLAKLAKEHLQYYIFPYNVGVMTFYVQSCLIAKKGNALFETQQIQKLYEKDPNFCVPYLMLCAATNHPDVSDPALTVSPRLGALALYYSGINKMLVEDYAGADFQFQKCLRLKHYCGDIIPELVNKMSFTAFLSRVPKNVFFNRLNTLQQPKGFANDIWNLDKPLPSRSNDEFSDQFIPIIEKERARLIILDLALVSNKIQCQELEAKIHFNPIEVLTALQEIGEIKFDIDGSNILLQEPIISTKIEEEIKSISQI